jgi:hypothetical protein
MRPRDVQHFKHAKVATGALLNRPQWKCLSGFESNTCISSITFSGGQELEIHLNLVSA